MVDLVDHLRISDGPLGETGFTPCRGLLAEADHLREIVAEVGSRRGLERPDVAMSIFVQGYAYRVASIAIGVWLLDGVVLDVRPENMAIAVEDGHPVRIRFEAYRPAKGTADLANLHSVLVDQHLAALVEASTEAMRIGRPLLWSNIGSSSASSFGAFMTALPDRWERIRTQAEEFFAAARPELKRSGSVVRVGPVWAWERNACCLWYQVDNNEKCSDCSLWSRAVRDERYRKVLERSAS